MKDYCELPPSEDWNIKSINKSLTIDMWIKLPEVKFTLWMRIKDFIIYRIFKMDRDITQY